MKRKIVSVLIIGTIVAATVTGCSTANAKTSEPETKDGVTVVHAVGNTNYYPLVFLGDDNELTGYAVDVNNAVDELLEEYTWEYEASSGDAILMGTEQGLYEEAIGGFYYTPERAEKFIFPTYNGGSFAGLVVTDAHDDVRDLSIAAQQKLKIAPTYAGGGLIAFLKDYNEKNPDNQVEYETIDERTDFDITQDVISGRYDYDLQNLHAYNKVVLDNPELGEKTNFYSFAAIKSFDLFNKDQQELADRYSWAIDQLKEDGTLQELYVKWFGEDIFPVVDAADESEYGIIYVNQ